MTQAGAAERTVGSGRLRLLRGDITRLRVDAVVNAANSELAGGGGVDGAIHRAAGWEELQAELRRRHPAGCAVGSAVSTGAHGLEANGVHLIVHAVGPRWRAQEAAACDRLLAAAYRTALTLVAEAGCASVALPSIATGVYGFPVERAAPIALGEAVVALTAPGTGLREVTMVLFAAGDLDVYIAALDAVSPAAVGRASAAPG